MRNGRLNSTPIIALVLAAACWGAATIITKHVLTNIPPLTLLVLQLTISVSFLWMIVFAQRLPLPQRRDIVRLGGIGIRNPGLAYTFGLIGVTRTDLQLREDVPGAQLWAVSLEHTMLTYFEVQPHSRFERHQHESEQITLVLDGELFLRPRARLSL
jgi:EamA-like transporter family